MSSACVEWGDAGVTRPGETVSGDRCLVLARRTGALLAIVDGLGHGAEAARAAETATRILAQSPGSAPCELLRRCHEGLLETRGVVLIVACFDPADGTLAWEGVGNLLGVLVHADAHTRPRREVLMPREGVAGRTLPPASRSLLSVRDRDQLVLATDGLRDAFVEDARPGDDPRRAAERMLARHARGHDDALVLVANLRVRPA